MRLSISLIGSVAFALAMSTTSYAQYDLSGRWLVTGTQTILGEATPYSPRHWDVLQNAGTLNVTMTDEDGNVTGPASGTINEATGAFEIDSIDGNVAADSLTFAATQTSQSCGSLGCIDVEISYNGSRCGNGSIEGIEECDDDNVRLNDCCSPSCTADRRGTACTSDGNVCTDDVCDGAGTCDHDANSASCVGGPGGCSAGTCSSGSCVASSPRTAGASCDLDGDHCTADTCDGAGACAAGGPLDCAPCGICDSDLGCVADAGYRNDCVQEPGFVSLKLGTGGGNRNKISLNIEAHNVFYSFPSADLGDPTLNTDYTLCLYGADVSAPQVILRASIPAAGTCGADPCWTRRDGSRGQLQFTYKDRERTPDGIKSARIRKGGGITLKGAGSNLDLPPELSLEDEYLRPMIIADDGTTRTCWEHLVEPERLTPAQFKGSYEPIP
jgi:cysteine-rich repeat protein